MSSRDISELTAAMAGKARLFLNTCELAGLYILIICTYRSLEDQARLFRQGRSLGEIRAKARELENEYGRPDLARLLMDVGPQYQTRIVTKAGPGQSIHNYRGAFDWVPLLQHKPVWSDENPEDAQLWQSAGEIAESCGLEWAGRWTEFRELGHCEEPTMNWRTLIRERAPGVA